MTTPTIIEFVKDPQLLGLSLSPAQETLQRTIYGLPLSEDHLSLYRACTGRQAPPAGPFGEATVIAGARSGKDSRVASPIVVYEAVFGGHERHLARGERGVIPLVAQDARAARIAFEYIKGYVTGSPLLAALVEDVLASEIVLTNGLSVSCFPCTLRSLRGWSIPVAVLDELGFYRLEGQVDSDVEIQASIRRGMIAFPTTRLIKISTPYMKSGVLFDDFKRGFGHDDPDLLVWRASSLLMNPSLRAERLDREQRLDPLRFAREYLGEFAEDIDVFLPSAWVEQAVVSGRHELPPDNRFRYVAAVDPSGGGADAFTLVVAHTEGSGTERRVVQDVMRGWSRRGSESLDLEGVVREIADLVRRYYLTSVSGDRYSAGWVRTAFRAAGISYKDATVRAPDGETKYLDKATAYLEIQPAFATQRIALLDHPQLIRELKLLESRPRVGGRTLVDHPSGAHDDYANALGLAAALCATRGGAPFSHAIDGVMHLGRPREHVGGALPQAGAGGQLARGPVVGGQAVTLGRFFRFYNP